MKNLLFGKTVPQNQDSIEEFPNKIKGITTWPSKLLKEIIYKKEKVMKIRDLIQDKEGIYVNPGAEFDYSDGSENEFYLYTTLKNSDDNSIFSPVLQKSIRNWSSEYHFSTYRCNILRPINIKNNWNILEIGAGCGAITRYLGESGASITAVEGSYNRAKCITQRCKNLKNVKVYCSNIEDLGFEEKFDMITLIGVFEYTAKYSKKENSFHKALELYKKLLNPNGILVIAIENKLGLKYFSGYDEDHTGTPYFGLENRYQSKDVRTFGKKELEKLIRDGGFMDLNILYPFPDYKLPKLILTNKAFQNHNFNIVDLIRFTKNRNYSFKPKANLLNENLLFSSLYENDLICDLSNSFLVIAKNSDIQKEQSVDYNLMAQFFSCDRKKSWSTVSRFQEDGGRIQVYKRRINSDNSDSLKSDFITQNLCDDMCYFEGQNLHHMIVDALNENNLEQFHKLINRWIEYLIENGLDQINSENMGKSKIKPNYYDCLPFNLIVENSSGNYNLIDEEWVIDKELDLYFLIIRYLSNFQKILGVTFGYSKSFRKFVNKILLKNNLMPVSNRKLSQIMLLDKNIMDKIMLPVRTTPLNLNKSFLILVRDKVLEVRQYLRTKLLASR